MKKIFPIFALLFSVVIFGQKISDFRYVMIPGTFKDTKTNRYDLNDLLMLKLKQKKYIALYENIISWPKEAVENPCNILNAELMDVSSMFRNKIQLKLVDCNGKEISSFEGKSMIKDFELGMRDALENAANYIAISNPVEQKNTAQRETATISTSVKTEKVSENTPKTSEKPEVYSNGKLTLNKISVANGEFILANPSNYVPYAIFKPSSKKDTYRVQLQDGTSTIGYEENGKIIVEIPNSDGSFQNEVFTRK